MRIDQSLLIALIGAAVTLIGVIVTASQTRRSARRDLEEAAAATRFLEEIEGHPLSGAVARKRDRLLIQWVSPNYRRWQILRRLTWLVLALSWSTAFVLGTWEQVVVHNYVPLSVIGFIVGGTFVAMFLWVGSRFAEVALRRETDGYY